jgi:hypothetical protein
MRAQEEKVAGGRLKGRGGEGKKDEEVGGRGLIQLMVVVNTSGVQQFGVIIYFWK